jgi:hypothetical protein
MLKEVPDSSGQAPYTHLLPLDRAFLNFLRLSCGFKRLSLSAAVCAKAMADREIEDFTKVLLRRGMS